MNQLNRHPLAIASACYALIALVLTGPALIGRGALGPDQLLDWDPLYRTAAPPQLPMLGDPTPTVLDYPRDLTFARALRAGRLDVWNPLSAAGAPLWAEQAGPFFPLKLPFYLAPSRETYHLFLALRLVAAAIGAYLLARVRRQRPIAALAAGAAFELSGALLAQLPFGNGSPVYMLPWVMLGSFAIAQRRSWLATTGTAVALGLAAIGGHPMLILMVFAAFAAAVIGHCLAAWRQKRVMVSIAAHAAVAVVLGLALAAACLLPLAELASVGTSYKNRTIGEATRNWSLLQSRRLVPGALFSSRLLGTLPSGQTAVTLSPSIGTLALLAALTGMVSGRFHLALLSVLGLGLGWTLAPAQLGLFSLPGLRLVLPIYAWTLVAMAATQAAGDGIEALTTPRAWRRVALALALFVTVGAVVQLGWSGERDPVRALLSPRRAPAAVVPAAVGGTMLCLCLLLQRARLDSLAAAGLAFAMVVEQLVTMAPLTIGPASAVFTNPPSPAVQFLQRQVRERNGRIAPTPVLVGYPASPMLFDLPDLRGMSALPVRRYYEYMQAMSPETGDFTVQIPVRMKSPLLDLAAVRYLVLAGTSPEGQFPRSPQEPEPNDPELPQVYDDGRIRVYENRAALARVRLVHRTTPVADEAAARRYLETVGRRLGNAGGLGLVDTAVIEPDAQGNPPPALSGTASEHESVRLVEQEDADRLLITAHLEQPGLVVIADTYYPGWKAWVDGRRAAIFPADLLFRAVPVPAGSHRVELRYEPDSFFHGVLLSALAAIICVVVVLRERKAGVTAASCARVAAPDSF